MDSFNNSPAHQMEEPQSACLELQGPAEQQSCLLSRNDLGKGRPAALQKIKRSESSGSLPSPSQDLDQIQIQQQQTSIHRSTSLLNFKDLKEPITQKAHKSTEDQTNAPDAAKNNTFSTSQDLYSNPSTRANTQNQEQAVKSQVNAASLSDEKVDSQAQNGIETFSDYKSTPSRTKDMTISISQKRVPSLMLSNKGHSDLIAQPMSILDCSLGGSGGDSDMFNQPFIPDDASDLEKCFHDYLDGENMKQVSVEKFLKNKNKYESTEVLRAFRDRKNSQLSMSSCSGSKLGSSSFYERRRKLQHQTGGTKSNIFALAAKDQHSQVTVDNPFLLPLQMASSVESVNTANEASMRFKKMTTLKTFDSFSQKN